MTPFGYLFDCLDLELIRVPLAAHPDLLGCHKLWLEDVYERLAGPIVAEWRAAIEFNAGAQEGWSGLLQLELPVFNTAASHEAIGKARAIVNAIVTEKAARPLEVVDVGPLEQATTIMQAIIDSVARYNDAIQALNEEIAKYKTGLTQVDMAALQTQRRVIELRIVRNAPEVLQYLSERTKAEGERKDAERKKDAARKTLDQLMAASLATFQEAINARLRDFGAPFSIRKLKPNYMGGGVPRSEYALEVRGASVPVGPANA